MKTKYMVLSGVGVLVLGLLFWPSEKDHLNAQMVELCKKDGGVKIYERVKLPSDAYTSGGVLKEKSYRKINVNESTTQIADNYEWYVRVTIIKEGEPLKGTGRLERDYTKIVRISDKKLLAESIFYSRGGGDRWFAGMPSSTICPANDEVNLLEKVFIKANSQTQGETK